ncbi:MAG: hypothetical protein AAF203_01645, partial [Pseudomonadota bacterium]
QYPDNAHHDSEALVVHPVTGDIFIFTKVLVRQSEVRKDSDDEVVVDTSYSGPSKIYKLSRDQWVKDSADGRDPIMSYVGQIDLDLYARPGVKKRYMHQAVTGADISDDGQKFVLLTYRDLFEFSLNLSKTTSTDIGNVEIGKNLSRIEIEKPDRLIQQEAVAYTPAGDIIYTSEFIKGEPGDENFAQNIMGLRCGDSKPSVVP